MKNWVKIIETPKGQMLIMKDFDGEKDMYAIKAQIYVEVEEAFINPAMTMRYDDIETRDKDFDVFEEKTEAIEGIQETFSEVLKQGGVEY